MRNTFAVAALALFVCSPASAQAPDGYETIYDAPTQVNLGGRPVVADIALHADRSAPLGTLRVALTTDVTKFIEETERDLENWVAARRHDCGERWDAGKPYIGFPKDAIRFAIDVELEYWTCGWDGKGEPVRIAREAGGVDVTLIPEIADGKLQARLGDFSLDATSGVSRYLPLEFVVRRLLDLELKKLNENPKFYRAPKPFYDAGFRYESISAEVSGGRVVISAVYRASGRAETLERLVEQIRAEGVTQ